MWENPAKRIDLERRKEMVDMTEKEIREVEELEELYRELDGILAAEIAMEYVKESA